MSIEEPNINPFTERSISPEAIAKREAFEKTQESLTRLEDYVRLLNEHLRDYPIPETKSDSGLYTIRKASYELSPGRTVELELSDSGTYHLRDEIKAEDGKTDRLSYEVTPEDKDNPRNRRGFLSFRPSSGGDQTELDYRGQAYETHYLTEFKGLKAQNLTEEGLHVPSQQQGDWDAKWHEFQMRLVQDDAFRDYLGSLSKQKDPEEDRLMARKLIYGGVKVEDAQEFMQRIKKLWEDAEQEVGSVKKRLKRFLGHDFPEKDIPKLTDRKGRPINKRPAEFIHGHQEVQETIAIIENRLREAIHSLDAKLLPDTDLPHRMSAEDIAKRNWQQR